MQARARFGECRTNYDAIRTLGLSLGIALDARLPHSPSVALRHRLHRHFRTRIEMSVNSYVYSSAAAGYAVLVAETGVEPLQLVARSGTSTFLLGGSRANGGLTSGPDPYEMLSASLAACTALTIRRYAQLRNIPLTRVQVGVSRRREAAGGQDIFDRSILLEGALDDMQRSALLDIATTCPVSKLLGRSVDIRVGPSGDGEARYAAEALSSYRDDLEHIAGDDPRMGFD
jgi:putative redox protein